MSSVVIAGNTSGSITLSAPATAGTNTITLPAETGTLVTTATSSGISGSAITTGTVGVSVGGTGVTSTTAYGVLAGGTTATGAFQNIGTGTAAQVLTSNGPGVLPSFQTLSVPAAAQIQTQIFTSPGTWTKPSSTTQVRVTCIGAGGSYNNASGGKGAPGGLGVAIVPVSAPVAITVGSNGGVNQSGTSSSFGPAVTATGGSVGPGSNGAWGAPGSSSVAVGTALLTGTSFANFSPFGVPPAETQNILKGTYATVGVITGNASYTGGASAWSTGSGVMAGAGNWTSVGMGGVVVVEWV